MGEVVSLKTDALRRINNGFEKKPEEIGNQKKNENHPDNSIVKFTKYSQKSRGDL